MRPESPSAMKRTIRQLTLPAALVVLAILVPAQVAGASVLAVEQDCADSDTFEQDHSREDLQNALTQIQADLAEYGTCKQMINAELAALAKANASKDPDDGGPSAAADLDGDGVVTPEEKAVAAKKAQQKRKQRNQEIAAVSDDLVQDDSATAVGDDSGGPSLPLILAIVALVCAGIGGGVWYAAKRNPAFADALRRVSPPFGNS
jgi:hypothetical protein